MRGALPTAAASRAAQGGVSSAAGMARLIAWNDYEHDPIAEGPSQAIMSRGDLYDRGRDDAKQSTLAGSRGAARKMAGGGIDAKYSTLTAATDGLVSFGRAGPTNDDQPTFCWTKDFSSTPHVGHPHCFDFEWGPFAPLKNAEE